MSCLYPFTDPITAESDPPKSMVRGKGCFVTDSQGRTYLDAVAGLWCVALGFDNQRLIAAAHEQMKALPYYHSFMGRTAAPVQRLAARLVEKLPGNIDHVFFGCSGSEAVDTATKLMCFYQNARNKPEKKKIVARTNAYHGSGHTSAALTGMTYCHQGFDLPGPEVLRIERPHYYADGKPGESEVEFSKRRARELDDLVNRVGADRVGAFIGEPVMGAGGVIPPPDGYWQEIQNVLIRHDILLIADEVITGFGRTGEWFGCEKYDIEPDMITLAKQLSAAYFPISAVGLSSEVHQTIASRAHEFGTLGHGFTYGGHPVGAAVALEALDIYEEMDLPAHVRRLSHYLKAKLAVVDAHPCVGDVRLSGLMAGVEFVTDTALGGGFARKVADAAEERGVLYRVIENTLAISPPLNVEEAELDQIVQTMSDSIQSVASQVGIQ